ncbi:Hpt domain-containing protein [Vibrio neonatus]|uniref:Hpt domain-containing protein n=1 Tax=Vibrio neonatus TaxID=278860 RepID=UPI0021C280F4|nr:Hpt domain-containing protein [Vibrio neonatus]
MDEFNLLQNDKIVSLSAQVGEEMMPTLLDLFKQELQEYIGQIDGVEITTQSRELIARTCHAIKGSAPSFGAILVTEKATQMDAFYKQQRLAEFDQQCQELVSILRRTVYKLEQLQAQLH